MAAKSESASQSPLSYAVVLVGGRQHRVAEGDVIRVDLVDAKVGETVDLDVVLYRDDHGQVMLGQPLVGGVKARAVLQEHARGPKVRVFKFRRRKGYRRNKGHRQGVSVLRVESINRQ